MSTLNRKEELLTYARLAQSYGFVPIPIKGKIPRFKNWQNIRFNPADPDKNIRRIDHLYNAKMADNLGIVTGEASGVVVLDVDYQSVPWFQELVRLNGGLPETFTVLTGNNGLHVYFQWEPRVAHLGNLNKILGQNIDFRTTGGQAIFPGSIGERTGQMYAVMSGYTERGPMIAEMPDWLLGLLDLDTQQKASR